MIPSEFSSAWLIMGNTIQNQRVSVWYFCIILYPIIFTYPDLFLTATSLLTEISILSLN